MYRLILLVTAAAVLISSQGYAQTRNHLLRGLSEVDLLIEELSRGAKPCGLTEEAIRAAAMYPLSSTKIELVQLTEVTLYINIITIHRDRSSLLK